jgi:hypothetical protein
MKATTQGKVAQAVTHFESLNEWHRTLPPPMQPSGISLANPLAVKWHTKRSLLQLHILFLGLFTEPYRDCLVELGRCHLSNAPVVLEDFDTLKHVEEQCVLAARQSALVAFLLQIDNLIRSRCWVSVYVDSTWYCFTSYHKVLNSAIPASLAVQYFYSALRRNCSSSLEKKLVKSHRLQLHI